MSASGLTCREIIDFLMSYLDGELPETQQSSFEQHLTFCPPCTAYLENYKRTIALGKEACSETEAPVPDELLRAILVARSQR